MNSEQSLTPQLAVRMQISFELCELPSFAPKRMYENMILGKFSVCLCVLVSWLKKT